MFSQFGLALFEGTFVLDGRDRLALSAAEASAAFMVCGLVMAVSRPVSSPDWRRRWRRSQQASLSWASASAHS